MRGALRAAIGLVFGARTSERPVCLVAEGPREGRWLSAQRQLLGCSIRYDRTLTNARLQNRPVAVPAADLPLESREGTRLRGPALPAWAIAVPLQPGRGMDGLLVMLTDRAPSAGDISALVSPAAAIAAKLARALQQTDTPAAGGSAPRRQDSGSDHEAPEGSAAGRSGLSAPSAPRPVVIPPNIDLNLLLGAFRDGLVVVNSRGDIVAANDSGRQLLGLMQPEEDARLAHPLLVEAHAAVLTGETPEDVELPIDAEPRRFIQLGAASTPVAGTSLIMLKDVTEERLIHERLLQSEKMASIGQLVSGVAHELNNPLTGITGFAQMLLLRDLPEDVRRQLSTIYAEAERASRIVQNLLSFARRRRPEKERVNINELIERVIDLRSYELRVQNIEPRTRLTGDLAPVLADPHQIQQVVLNVVRNAEHAIQERGGDGVITCTTASDDEWVRLAIVDDGAGIPPENLRRIFDPFFTTKQVGEGTGLGLTISYGIVEEHGGHISVDSQPGRGTTVNIELPAAPGAPAAAGSARNRQARRVPHRSILVVDDEPSIRDLLTAMLLEDGHDVEAAADGADGLERLAARDFDLIITDVKMPGVDGVEFYQRVKTFDATLAERIIFTTGDMISPATRDFLESVSNPHLLKPFRLPDVRAMVTKMLPR